MSSQSTSSSYTKPSGKAPSNLPVQHPCQHCIDASKPPSSCLPTPSNRSVKCTRCQAHGLSPCKVVDKPIGLTPQPSTNHDHAQKVQALKDNLNMVLVALQPLEDTTAKAILTSMVQMCLDKTNAL